jgi:hypothetical protein
LERLFAEDREADKEIGDAKPAKLAKPVLQEKPAAKSETAA